MKRGMLLCVALVISGLTNLFMMWVQVALILKIFVIYHVAFWADISGWLGTFALVVVLLSAISDRPISPNYRKFIRVVGIAVIVLMVAQFLTNHIYVMVQTNKFL